MAKKKAGSNPHGLKHEPPSELGTRAAESALPIRAKDPGLVAVEYPLRALIQAVKSGSATPEMARDYSLEGDVAIVKIAPAVEREAKANRGRKAGHAAIHGTAEEKQARWARMQKLVDEKLAANPRLSHSGASKIVAEKLTSEGIKCVARTVRLHTVDPRRKK